MKEIIFKKFKEIKDLKDLSELKILIIESNLWGDFIKKESNGI